MRRHANVSAQQSCTRHFDAVAEESCYPDRAKRGPVLPVILTERSERKDLLHRFALHRKRNGKPLMLIKTHSLPFPFLFLYPNASILSEPFPCHPDSAAPCHPERSRRICSPCHPDRAKRVEGSASQGCRQLFGNFKTF